MDAPTTRRGLGTVRRRLSETYRVRVRPVGSEPPLGPTALAAAAVWLGAVTGLVEVGLVLAPRLITDAVTFEMFRRNRHHVRMIPAANLIISSTCGAPAALVALVGPRRIGRLLPNALVFLAAAVGQGRGGASPGERWYTVYRGAPPAHRGSGMAGKAGGGTRCTKTRADRRYTVFRDAGWGCQTAKDPRPAMAVGSESRVVRGKTRRRINGSRA